MNCRRIQSLLSAYLDGELTGEEMIAVRNHLSICEYCTDEHSSLQVVKKLLGGLDTVDSRTEWTSTITARAFAGTSSWWSVSTFRRQAMTLVIRPSADNYLTPRGVRMVRALALSTAVVFLAAVRLSSIERLDQGVTGRMAASMGIPLSPWSSSQRTTLKNIGAAIMPDDESRYSADSSAIASVPETYGVRSAQSMSIFASTPLATGSPLTFVSTTQK